jgi:hypothetical protein
MGDYNKVTNCGFMTGGSADGYPDGEYSIASIGGGSSYSLVEDCWVWGKGRYGFYTSSPNGGTNHIIFRRVIVRLDSTPAGVMTAGLRFYYSSNNIMQNCIIIDGNWNSASAELHGMATGGGSSNGDLNDTFIGNIVLNNPLIDCYWSEKGTQTHILSNNVCWGNYYGPATCQDFESPFTINFGNNTVGNNSQADIRSHYSSITFNDSSNLIFTKSGGSSYSDQAPNATGDNVYLASGASIGSPPSAGYTSTNNATLTTLSNAGLKYLPRIEAGSALAVAGAGANILYQQGVSGTLYGETGYNTLTSTQLWPYPNEQLWANKS